MSNMKISFIGSNIAYITTVWYGSYPMLSHVILTISLCSWSVNYICKKLECCEVKEHGVFGVRKVGIWHGTLESLTPMLSCSLQKTCNTAWNHGVHHLILFGAQHKPYFFLFKIFICWDFPTRIQCPLILSVSSSPL